ncbi:MAG: hypothetical protein ACPGO5_00195 [Patescibacteria group bacterium]
MRGGNNTVKVVVCIDEQLPNMRRDQFSTKPWRVINYDSGKSDESIGEELFKKASESPDIYYLVITLDGGFKRRAGKCGVWKLRNTDCVSIWHYPRVIEQAMRGVNRRRRNNLANFSHADRRPKISAIKMVYEDYVKRFKNN